MEIVALDLCLNAPPDSEPLTATTSADLGWASAAAWTDTVRRADTAHDDEVAFVADMALAQFAAD